MKIGRMAKMGLAALKANTFDRRVPLNVMLAVTNRCAGNCAYCRIPQRDAGELTQAEICGIIDEISALGCQRLGLWGGEPLVRDDINDIILHAKGKGIFVTMDSNGFLLPQKTYVLRGLDHLVLALDGEEASHDANRGQGSFLKAMAAIEAAAGLVPTWTITVITKNNLGSLDFILETAEKYGMLATFQVLHHNDVLARPYADLRPPDEASRQFVRRVIERKKKGAPIASTFRYLEHLLRWPDLSVATSEAPLKSAQCWAGRLYCNVDTDGSLYPCSLMVGKGQAPNALKLGFKEAFAKLTTGGCRSCCASCFTEYNYLFSLDAQTVAAWCRSMARR